MKRSFFLCAFALFATAVPQVLAANVHMNVSNDNGAEGPVIPLYDISGQALNNGAAMLGTLEGSGWSYDVQSNLWNDGHDSYNQNDLTFSQLAKIRTGFRSTLIDIDSTQSGAISNGGLFSLSGNYTIDSALSGKPIYIKVQSDSGFSIFLVQSKDTTGSPATWPSDFTNNISYDFQPESSVDLPDFPYYVTCILGNTYNGGFQLLVPEPATATLSLLGLAALMVRRRRK